MPRKAKVNREKLAELVKQGMGVTQITDYFIKEGVTVSKQAISQAIKKLPNQPETNPNHRQDGLTWDTVQEKMFKTFQQAKTVEQLADENWRLRNRVAALEAQIKGLEEDQRVKRQYQLAVQQGDLPEALLAGGKK